MADVGAEILSIWGATASAARPATADNAVENPSKYRRNSGKGGAPPQGRKKGVQATEREEGPRPSRPDSLLNRLAALTLRHEAQLQMLEVDRSYVLFLSTEPLGVMSLVREANERWQIKEANKVTASLRCTLLTSVLLELQARVQKVENDPATRRKCEEGGWCSTGGEEGLRWIYKRWDPAAKEAKTVAGEGLSQAELQANLTLLIQHAKQDGVLLEDAVEDSSIGSTACGLSRRSRPRKTSRS